MSVSWNRKTAKSTIRISEAAAVIATAMGREVRLLLRLKRFDSSSPIHWIIFWAYQNGYTKSEIGRAVLRHHSTIGHSLDRHEWRRKQYPELEAIYERTLTDLHKVVSNMRAALASGQRPSTALAPLRATLSLREAGDIIARAFGARYDDLLARKRHNPTSPMHWVILWAHQHGGYSIRDIAIAVKRDHSSIAVSLRSSPSRSVRYPNAAARYARACQDITDAKNGAHHADAQRATISATCTAA